ncbi:hypothetical protein [Paenibacillus glucanolyticus]|nr:hypothetical protein [Paenibacillus glucanolyticus]
MSVLLTENVLANGQEWTISELLCYNKTSYVPISEGERLVGEDKNGVT